MSREQSNKKKIRELLSQCGFAPGGERLDKFKVYLDLLTKANKKFALVSRAEGPDELASYLVKSVHLAAAVFHVEHPEPFGKKGVFHVEQYNTPAWVDVASGAGIPALPLRILHPDLPLVMIEPKRKKMMFLEEAVRVLEFGDVQVLGLRAEEAQKELGGKFALCTAQGLGPLSYCLDCCLPFLSKGGIYVSWRGKDIHKELRKCGKALERYECSVRETAQMADKRDGTANTVVVEKLGKTDV